MVALIGVAIKRLRIYLRTETTVTRPTENSPKDGNNRAHNHRRFDENIGD